MQMIVYPGNASQPCQAEYGIAITRDASTTRADIVVIDSHKADLHHTALTLPRRDAITTIWNDRK